MRETGGGGEIPEESIRGWAKVGRWDNVGMRFRQRDRESAVAGGRATPTAQTDREAGRDRERVGIGGRSGGVSVKDRSRIYVTGLDLDCFDRGSITPKFI